MQAGIQFGTRLIQVNILVPDVLFAQGVHHVIQHAKVAHGRVSPNIRRLKVKARQAQIQRQAAQHCPNGGGGFRIANPPLLAKRIPLVHSVLIQPDHTVNRNRLQMADQRLHARQAARTSGDQQYVTAVVGDGFTHRMDRRGQGELSAQHRRLQIAKVNLQRHGEEIERRSAGWQGVIDGLLQVVHDVTRGLLA